MFNSKAAFDCGDKYLYANKTKKTTLYLRDIQDKNATLLWMIKHTGFHPQLFDKKKILTDGKYSFAIPMNDEGNLVSVLSYQLILRPGKKRKALVQKVEFFENGLKVSSDDLSIGKELKKQIKFLNKEMDFNDLSAEIRGESIYEKFTLPVNIDQEILKQYDDFLERYFYKPDRNKNVLKGREQENLARIRIQNDLINLNRKIKSQNLKSFILERSKKHFGGLPASFILGGITVLAYQKLSDEDTPEDQSDTVEKNIWNLSNQQFGIEKVFIYEDSVEEYIFLVKKEIDSEIGKQIVLYDENNHAVYFEVLRKHLNQTVLKLL